MSNAQKVKVKKMSLHLEDQEITDDFYKGSFIKQWGQTF